MSIVADPPDRKTVPRSVSWVSSKKSTTPVGTSGPGPLPWTVACRATNWSKLDAKGEIVKVVALEYPEAFSVR